MGTVAMEEVQDNSSFSCSDDSLICKVSLVSIENQVLWLLDALLFDEVWELLHECFE